ncbi:MAG: mercuric reductase [Pseudomonadota bacterium]|nr:mercuric reductase [Pseudomonadota bacterium]
MDLPASPQNDELLNEVHPPHWINPEGAGIYDIIVIGAGPAGLVAAWEAAGRGHRAALIERDMIGGDCFNVGCIPSKTIIRTARLFADMRNASQFGAHTPENITVDFAAVMQRMRHVRARVAKEVSVHRLKEAGIDVFLGTASFVGKTSLAVGDSTLHFKKALIATGSRPEVPRIKGLAEAGFLTNEDLFNLKEAPESLLVIGGGPLGCEMAQAFSRLGSEVSISQREPMFLANVERDGAQILSNALARDGIGIYLNARVLNISSQGKTKRVDLLSDDTKSTIEVEQILVSAGRRPNVRLLDLEKAEVAYTPHSGVEINDYLQTTNPNIYAAGDVCPDRKFDHVQEAAARAVIANALEQGQRKLSALITPWCIYTTPEVAHVGLHVREAREQNIPIKTYTVLMHQVDRAIADGEEEGFVKIHLREGSDEILGATIVARHAGDIINYVSLAMAAKLGLTALAEVSFPYPTQAQAVRMAALSFMQSQNKRSL